MKKGFNILMMMMGALLLVSACGKSNRTLVEMQKDERKAIRKLMDSLNIQVIKDYPADGKFAENEFLELKSGLYMNVIDSGNGTRAVLGSTKVFCRFEMDYIDVVNNRVAYVNGFDNMFQPMEFTYITYNIPRDLIEDRNLEGLFSQGIVEPLEYVGDNSYVKLIVPFKVGSLSQQRNGDPIYYKRLRYVFEK